MFSEENFYSSIFIKLITPLVLLVSIILLQYYFDIEKQDRPLIPPTIIPVQAIKLGDLGLHSAISTLIWIYTIQQVPVKTDELIKSVNSLDPKFSYPYAFAAFFLPPFNATDQAIEIAKDGIKNADTDWRIPYYLATTYHIFSKDRKNSAFYFDIAANTPEAPDKIKAIAARYGASKSALEESKEIWTSIYETSNDEILIERARNYITHIEIIQALEKAILIYRQKYGYYPLTMDSLVSGRILKEVPKSPLGVKITTQNGKIIIE